MPSRRTFLRAVGGTATIGGVGSLLSGRRLPGTCRPRREPTWERSGRSWTTPAFGPDALFLGEWFGATGIRGTARLVALNSWEGSAAWARTVTGAGWGRPAVTDDAVYAGTGNKSVHAFDPVTGDTLWVWDGSEEDTIGGGAWARPAVADGTVFVAVSTARADDSDPPDDTDYDHRVVALNAREGTVRWTADTDRSVFSDPAVVAGTLVVAAESGTVYGLDPADGSERWVVSRDAVVGQPVVAGGESVVALDAKTGEAAWTATPPGTPTALDATEDRLFLGDDEGNAVSYGLRDGRERWRFRAEAPVGGIAGLRSETDQTDSARADEVSVEARVADHIGYVYAVTDAGTRTDRFHISESGSDDRCGWDPSRRWVNGATARGDSLYVSTEWSVERFEIDGD
ncbi:PQQ-binding-like beta-propeller repeat protein [Halopelagius fulvigenes]|uniref:PQQ-binding-like beta-propeller repeat protein n=1 Tax=Halopelagius fulvigenes TaxID=1198324 RepID=A0ABD5TU20_9EURY